MAEALPPMAEMWDEWSKTVSLSFDPNDAPANYSWSGDLSPAVHALMKQVRSESKYISLHNMATLEAGHDRRWDDVATDLRGDVSLLRKGQVDRYGLLRQQPARDDGARTLLQNVAGRTSGPRPGRLR